MAITVTRLTTFLQDRKATDEDTVARSILPSLTQVLLNASRAMTPDMGECALKLSKALYHPISQAQGLQPKDDAQ